MDAALLSLLNQGSAWVLGGVVPHRRGNRHPSITPYETFEAADRPIAVAVGNDRLFARLCEALGAARARRPTSASRRTARASRTPTSSRRGSRPVLAHAPRRGRGSTALRAAAVPAGPINDVAEAFALAESLGMEPVARGRRLPAAGAAAAARRRAPARSASPPPRLDEHGDELRAWLSAKPPVRPARSARSTPRLRPSAGG